LEKKSELGIIGKSGGKKVEDWRKVEEEIETTSKYSR